MKIFKIQRLEDGLFAKAGSQGFSKRGKTWNARGHVSLHLNETRNDYKGCVLIEYDVEEDGGTTVVTKTPMEEVLKERKEHREKVEAERRIINLKRKQEFLEEEQLRIAKELEKLKNV